jgi:hypothetical protein
MSESAQTRNLMKVGTTHFKGEYKKYCSSNYTLPKALKEFIDNIAKKCRNINVWIKVSGNRLYEIMISDDYLKGFENIHSEGIENPFNMTHIRGGQDDDMDMSQFGIGMKAGAIATGLKMVVYTRVANVYYCVILDFNRMCREQDREASFSPEWYPITQEQYNAHHPFEYGSTIVFSGIRENIYKETTEEMICNYVNTELSKTYRDIIKWTGINIKVNDLQVLPAFSFFEEPQCSPFNENVSLFHLEKVEQNKDGITQKNTEYYAYFENENKYRLQDKETKNFKIIPKTKLQSKYINAGYKYVNQISSSNLACIDFESTFVMYHPLVNTGSDKERESYMPKGRAIIYMQGRSYGNWNKESTNGSSNFTEIEIRVSSKKVANELGLTFNKDISKEHQNDLTLAVKEIISSMTGKLSGDTSTPNNKKLYDKALLNGIQVPENRLPKSVSPPKVKPTAIAGGGASGGASPDTSPKPPTLSVVELLAFQEEEQERKERLEKEKKDKEKKDKEEQDKKEKERKEKERKEKERLELEQEEKSRIEEEKRKEQIEYGRKLELERLEKERLENISFTIVDPDPVKVEPKPTHIPVGSAIHTNLSIKDGIQILEQLKTQSNSYTILDTINKILYDYLNNCPAATLDKIFKYIPNDNTRIEMLLEQITLKYPLLFEQSKPMLGGAELYRLVNS